MIKRKPITIVRPSLPKLESYVEKLQHIWESGYLSKQSSFAIQFESQLQDLLDAPGLRIVNSGTTALQLAIRALKLKGEVITSSLSYISTASAIAWEGCTPVCVDIREADLQIDPKAIEAAINVNTVGIIAPHIYGIPAAIEELEGIAKKHRLKLIFDAAQTFNQAYSGRDITTYGDCSILSFSATKLINTVEGGAIITQDQTLANSISELRMLGMNTKKQVVSVGTNAYMSEFHAAMGLCLLEQADDLASNNQTLVNRYRQQVNGLPIRFLLGELTSNCSNTFLPIILESESQLLKTIEVLENLQIFPKRYFFPLLADLSYVKCAEIPVARALAPRILCLPLHPGMDAADVDYVCSALSKSLET